MRLGTWTQGDAGRLGGETEMQSRGGKTTRADGLHRLNRVVPSRCPPLRESELGRRSPLPPSRFQCQGPECLEEVRNSLRRCPGAHMQSGT